MPTTPFISVPDCVKAEMRFTQQGQKCENVFHFTLTGGWDTTSMTDLAESLKQWHSASLHQRQANAVSLDSIVITNLATNVSPGIEYAIGLPVSGIDGDAQLPMNVTLAIKFLTEFRGRSYRGRCYHIGLVQGRVVGSVVDPTSVAALQTVYTNLIAAAGDVGAEFVVASLRANNAWRAVGVTTPVIAVSVDNTIDSQRRRLPGRGA